MRNEIFPQTHKYVSSQTGFTYIELLIVVAIVGIIATFSLVMSTSSISRSSVIAERDLFVSLLLSGARAQAIANVNQSSHGIHIDNRDGFREYTLFDGTIYDEDDPSNRVTKFTNENITIVNADEDPDEWDIVFEQLSGNVISGAGDITISGNGAELDISINEVGQINW